MDSVINAHGNCRKYKCQDPVTDKEMAGKRKEIIFAMNCRGLNELLCIGTLSLFTVLSVNITSFVLHI